MNKKRSVYSFANVNLLGKCNLNCRWCLGKDLPEIYKYNHLGIHYNHWKNFSYYLKQCEFEGIKQLYITGLNCDSLQYKYLNSLINYLQLKGFRVGIRTNGVLALEKMHIINRCDTCKGDAVGYTYLSPLSTTFRKITGSGKIPDWDVIFNNTKVPFRVSVVIDKNNFLELPAILSYLSRFEKIKYVQLRKISTVTRQKFYAKEQWLYEIILNWFKSNMMGPRKLFESALVFELFDQLVTFWKTIETTANSLNYFTNGIVSKNYEIVKGYLENKEQIFDGI